MTWREAYNHLQQSERARRRALASAGMCVFLGGMLVAAGLGLLLLAALVVAVSLASAVTVVRALVRRPPWRRLHGLGAIKPSVRAAGQLVVSGANDVRRRGGASSTRFARKLGRIGRRGGASGIRFGGELARIARRGRGLRAVLTRAAVEVRARWRARSGIWTARARTWTAAAVHVHDVSDAAADADTGVSWLDPRMRAVELNSHGAALRREGKPTSAIEQHEQALELVRWTGDRDLEAPTLNSLGLALAAAGETDAAVERFEESIEILRELSNDDQEGKVIANLGLTLLKKGDEERGRELLATALEKLPSESAAAQRVEVELRRAS